jgi:hypothetical protein
MSGGWAGGLVNGGGGAWRILPLHTPGADGRCSCGRDCGKDCGKHPRTPHGLLDATTDEATVRAWSERWPDANVAILTGAANDLWVLDADGAGGLEALAALERQHGQLPPLTPRVRTGGGGLHYYFKWPTDGTVIRNCTRLHGLPIDVRGEGGYVVAPPSRHRSGTAYAWELAPGEGIPAEAPAWLLALVRGHADDRNGKAAAPAEGEPIPEGRRNDTLTRLAGSMRAAGLAADAILAALLVVNRNRCRPPLPDKEVETIARSVARYETWGLTPPRLILHRKPGTAGPSLPKPADFPTDALPPVLAEFTVQTAAAMGCPTPFVALPVLAATLGCVGNRRRILVKRRWEEPAVGWFGIIGESGTLKSPAQREALAPLRRVAARLVREHREAMRAFSWEREKYQKLRAEALKEAADAAKEGGEIKEPPAEPERPPDVRVLVQDITIEKLAPLLADNPQGLLLARDELSGWIGSMTRYGGKDVASGDLPHWLSIFNAEPILVDRKTGDRPTIHVPSAAVSLVGGIQPGIWRRVMKAAHYDSGLVARLLIAWPAEGKKAWTEAEASPACVGAYEELLEKLLALRMCVGEDGPTPFLVRMTPEARAAWVRFYGEWAERQAGADGEPRAMLSKLEGYCARLALIHHAASRVGAGQDDCDPVEADSVEAAVKLTRWFAAEGERAYCGFFEDEATRERRRLVGFLRAHDGQISPRTLHKSNRSRYPTTADAERALEALASAGLGSWVPSTGGRPGRVFQLAPEPPPDPDGEEDGSG